MRGFDKLGNAAGERRKILENRSRTTTTGVAVGDINSPPKLPRRIIALFVSPRFGRGSRLLGELTLMHSLTIPFDFAPVLCAIGMESSF